MTKENFNKIIKKLKLDLQTTELIELSAKHQNYEISIYGSFDNNYALEIECFGKSNRKGDWTELNPTTEQLEAMQYIINRLIIHPENDIDRYDDYGSNMSDD